MKREFLRQMSVAVPQARKTLARIPHPSWLRQQPKAVASEGRSTNSVVENCRVAGWRRPGNQLTRPNTAMAAYQRDHSECGLRRWKLAQFQHVAQIFRRPACRHRH